MHEVAVLYGGPKDGETVSVEIIDGSICAAETIYDGDYILVNGNRGMVAYLHKDMVGCLTA